MYPHDFQRLLPGRSKHQNLQPPDQSHERLRKWLHESSAFVRLPSNLLPIHHPRQPSASLLHRTELKRKPGVPDVLYRLSSRSELILRLQCRL